MFNFLKRKKEDVPPDLGQEEAPKAEEEESDSEEYEEPVSKKKGKKGKKEVVTESKSFEVERLKAKLESFESMLKNHSERFSTFSQQLGEVRAMGMESEKMLAKYNAEAERAVDVVKEIKPEKLRLDYQKLGMKVDGLGEKLEANKQFMDTIMAELSDLRRKAGIFVGTEALLKLNDEIKRDLVDVQKMNSRVKLNADKSEELFISFKEGMSGVQKAEEIAKNLDVSYSGVRKEIEKLKIDYGNMAKQSELADMRKTLNSKFEILDGELAAIEKVKKENERLADIVGATVAIAKRNKEDIADIAATIGNDHIQRIGDYENQLISILKVLDTLAGQMVELRSKAGIKEKTGGKIHVQKEEHHGKIKLNHIKIHQVVSKKPKGKIAKKVKIKKKHKAKKLKEE